MDDAPSLLARMRAPRSPRQRDAHTRLDAVRAHLEVLLNTRAGSSLLDPTYGLPDLTDHMLAGTSRDGRVARLIEACVGRHEPRLTRVSVHEIPRDEAHPTRLGFALTAALRDGTPLRLSGHIGHGTRVALHALAHQDA